MEVRRFVRRVWLRAWLILLAAAVAGAVAFGGSSLITATYTAQSLVVVRSGLGTSAGGTDLVLNAPRIGQTYAQLALTRPVLQSVISDLGLPYDPVALSRSITVTPAFDSPFVTILARDSSPARAAAIADKLAAAIVKLSTPPPTSGTPAAAPDPILAVVETAAVPIDPSSPRVLLNTVLAALAAAVVCLVLLSLREYLDDHVRSAADLDDEAASLVGTVSLPQATTEGIAIGPDLDGAILESGAVFAGLVQRLPDSVKLLGVTSPAADPAAGYAALGLATAASATGKRTILVDADLSRPSIDRMLNLRNNRGVASLLANPGAAASGAVQASATPNLSVVTSGPPIGSEASLTSSIRAAQVLRELSRSADIVVVVAPPMLGDREGAALVTALADTTVLVASANHTTRADVRRATVAVRTVGGRLTGILLAMPSRRGVAAAWGTGAARPNEGTPVR